MPPLQNQIWSLRYCSESQHFREKRLSGFLTKLFSLYILHQTVNLGTQVFHSQKSCASSTSNASERDFHCCIQFRVGLTLTQKPERAKE